MTYSIQLLPSGICRGHQAFVEEGHLHAAYIFSEGNPDLLVLVIGRSFIKVRFSQAADMRAIQNVYSSGSKAL